MIRFGHIPKMGDSRHGRSRELSESGVGQLAEVLVVLIIAAFALADASDVVHELLRAGEVFRKGLG